MLLSPAISDSASQLASLIEDVHSFLRQAGLRVGSPDDVAAFARAISGRNGFADQLASLLRAGLLREAELPTRVELLEALALAVGGPELDLQAPAMKQPVREIFVLVCEVDRSLRKGSSLNAVAPITLDPKENPAATTSRKGIFPAQTLYARDLTSPAPPVISAPVEARLSSPLPHRLDHEVEAPRKAVTLVPARSLPATSAFVPVIPEPVVPEPVLPVVFDPVVLDPPLRFSERADVREPLEQETRGRFRRIATGFAVLFGLPLGLCLFQQHATHRVARITHAPGMSTTRREAPKPALRAPKPSPYPDAQVARGAFAPRTDVGTTAQAASPTTYRLTERTRQPGTYVLAERQALPEPRSRGEASRDAPTYASAAVERGGPLASAPRYTGDVRPVAIRNGPAVPTAVGPDRIAAALSGAPTKPLSQAFPVEQPGVFLASSGVMTRNLLSAPSPVYPARASAERVEGQVTLEALVGRDGSVLSTRVLHGNPLLGEAAVEAVRHWRYRPYVVDGRSTQIATNVTVGFRLRR